MKIVVGDVYCTIIRPSDNPKAVATIRDVCKARPNGYQFMGRYRQGVWDGYINLASLSQFPTGLLSLVVEALTEIRYPFELEYKYIPIAPKYDFTLNGVELRDYQIDAVKKLLAAKRGIAKMATNSGKTEVMAAIIKALGIPKTTVLLHRKELLYQTAERFEQRLGIECGRVGDGLTMAESLHDVNVCMIQTVSRQVEWLKVQDNVLLMCDETHHASSDSYMDVMKVIPGAYRYGFSGTPLNRSVLSDLKLIAMTGPVVVEVTNAELIDEGYSAVPEIRMARMPVWSEHKNDGYQMAYEELIVQNDFRNEAIGQYARAEKGTVLILVERLEHGANLQALTGATFVTGSHSTDERRKVLDTMRTGDGGIFIATPIFDEGVDVPALDCVILAGGGKSQVKLLQRIGRGLRKKAGDNKLVVYDFMDDSNKYLKAHSKKRVETYQNERFSIKYI